MKRQSEILSKSKQYAQDMKLQAGLREDMEGVVKDGVMDRESALNAMELQKQRLEDFEKTALAEIKAERDSLYDLAGLAKAEAEDALQQGEIFKGTELLASAETLKHEADERYKAAQSSIDAKLEASKKKIAQDWAELLRTVYGEDFANLADAYTKDETRSGLLWKWIADGLGMEYNSEVKNMLLEKMKSGGVEEVGKWLRDEMIVAVTNGINDPNGAVSFYMETLGGNLFDLLTDNAKQNLMNNLYKLTGDVTTASEIFQSMFNIPFGSMDPFIANIPVEVKPEVINEEELKKPALSIPGLSYKAPDEQLEVAGAVKEIAPVDATEYTESMNTVETETEDTVKKCEELYGELRQMVLSSDLSDDAKRGWLGGLADLFNKDDLSGLEKIKEYISLDNWDIAFERLQKYLSGEGWNFDMSVPPVDDTKFNSSLEAMKRAVDEAVAYIQRSLATLNGSSVGLNVNAGSYSGWSGGIRRMVPKAQGGPVKSGDLVLANENGNFEMMGKMGNQPVVANNQQIVAGISSGVAQANGRVESRLSAIENLMTRLLQKEFVAKAVPTSAWGAHNARSADAYDRVTG